MWFMVAEKPGYTDAERERRAARRRGSPQWRDLLGFALLCLVSAGATAQPLPASPVVAGRALIVDGDTLEIGSHRIHLFGIDAPEPEQNCQRAGSSWRCGAEATYALAALIETHWLSCRERARTPAGEIIALCQMGGPRGPVVNREMVRQGWALAAPQASQSFTAVERAARAAKVGLWTGSFETPWDWRRARGVDKAAN